MRLRSLLVAVALVAGFGADLGPVTGEVGHAERLAGRRRVCAP